MNVNAVMESITILRYVSFVKKPNESMLFPVIFKLTKLVSSIIWKRYNRFDVDTVIEITRIVSHAPEAILHASAMHWFFWNVLVFLGMQPQSKFSFPNNLPKGC